MVLRENIVRFVLSGVVISDDPPIYVIIFDVPSTSVSFDIRASVVKYIYSD